MKQAGQSKPILTELTFPMEIRMKKYGEMSSMMIWNVGRQYLID